MLLKSTLREIKNSLGRYIAILAITALGVGFFSGLKTAQPDMLSTASDYLKDTRFFDYHMLSSVGFDDSAIKEVDKVKGIDHAEGSISCDFLASSDSDQDIVLKALMITDKTNKITVTKGRMPKASNECVIDENYALTRGNMIGKEIEVSADNEENTYDMFAHKKYKVVGYAITPLYMDHNRGTTSLGNGSIKGFMLIPHDGFGIDYYTEIYACFSKSYELYSSAYDHELDDTKDAVTEAAEKGASERLENIKNEALDTAKEEALKAAHGMVQFVPSDEKLLESIDLPSKADVYVLDRTSNRSYQYFDNDTSIIDKVATIFPIFFLLVAALVCMTTMTRMIDEQRTQIGVLKALGFSNRSIMGKYLFYSSSAASIGSILGFFCGSYIFPTVIWNAYSMLYNFSDSTNHIYNMWLCLACVIAAVACAAGSTLVSCSSDFKIAPAQLIRPKSPKAGKRILLERIPFIWNKLGFLYKVSFRNVFRYKKRFFMMIIGISGCTALLVTGFGIHDSIANIGDFQYKEITYYDYAITFKDEQSNQKINEFEEFTDGELGKIKFVNEEAVDVIGQKDERSIKLVAADKENLSDFVSLHRNGKNIKYPGDGEIILCEKVCNLLNLKVGDKITLRREDGAEKALKLTGIFENFISSYAYINESTYTDVFDKPLEYNAAYANSKNKDDKAFEVAAEISKNENVAAVTVTEEMQDTISSMLNRLNAVIILIILSAGALAFIVLYNLTNINITERIREIATIKVLGFYPRETSSYVFRENFFLTGIGAFVGLFLGKLLHAFVISSITVEMVSFDNRILPMSYLYSFALTFLFTIIVSGVMYFKLKKISMTESLKSIE